MLFIGIILLVYGVVKALFGYKLYRLSLFFTGFFVGAVIGGLIGAATESTIAAIVAGLLFGVLFGILNVVLMKLGIFIQCLAYGFMAVMVPAVMKLLNTSTLVQGGINYLMTGSSGLDDPRDMVPLALIVGIILGIIGVILSRIIIILTTAVFGGMISGISLCALVVFFNTGLLLITAMAIAVLGMVVQFLTTGKKAVEQDMPQTAGNQPGEGIPVTQPMPVAEQAMAMPESGMMTHEKSVPKVDIGRQTAAAQEYASKALGSLKENGGRAAEAARRTSETGIANLQNRQRSEEEAANSRSRGFSMEELLIQAESCLYRNRIMAWIFPFLEAWTIAATLLLIVIGMIEAGRYYEGGIVLLYGVIAGLERGKIVFLLAAFLGMIKRRPLFALGVWGAECLVELVMGIVEPISFFSRIWTIALYLLLMFWCYRIFFVHSGGAQGLPAGKVMAAGQSRGNSMALEKLQDSQVCPQCGAAITSKMKFCAKCGQTLL